MTEAELFSALGKPLGTNPAIALQPIPLPVWTPETGPYHKVQYVIEIVGPNLIPAQTVKSLLEQSKRASLGNPELYVMAPGMRRWQAMWAGDNSISYDSLAFAWDLVTPRGQISEATATKLWNRAEGFAKTIQRRAAPLPPPSDAAIAAKNISALRDSLDIGVDLLIAPRKEPISTAKLCEVAYSIGFSLHESGLLEFRQQGWPEALVTILPAFEGEYFDVRTCPTLDGVAIGFSLPCSPSPEQALDRTFDAAQKLCDALDGVASNDEGRIADAYLLRQWSELASKASAELEKVGIKPGSAEALRIFTP